jgi:hypothetical protein
LRENIAAVMPQELSDIERKVGALRAWSIVHGLAMLVLDRQIEYDETLILNVISGTKI